VVSESFLEEDTSGSAARGIRHRGRLGGSLRVPRSLTQPERTIIVRRYGIDVRQPKKLADVAEEFGLSRERVYQLQRRAEDSLWVGMRANLGPATSE
jgi:DNA-directed RNA polymerase sigma subunit (sigma70/sigma32)